MSVCGGSFLETCQHIDVEKMYTPALRAKLFVFVVRVNKLIIVINYIDDDVEELNPTKTSSVLSSFETGQAVFKNTPTITFPLASVFYKTPWKDLRAQTMTSATSLKCSTPTTTGH